MATVKCSETRWDFWLQSQQDRVFGRGQFQRQSTRRPLRLSHLSRQGGSRVLTWSELHTLFSSTPVLKIVSQIMTFFMFTIAWSISSRRSSLMLKASPYYPFTLLFNCGADINIRAVNFQYWQPVADVQAEGWKIEPAEMYNSYIRLNRINPVNAIESIRTYPTNEGYKEMAEVWAWAFGLVEKK